MALSEKQIIKLKVEYESGEMSKTKIAQKHQVSRNTLAKYAEQGKWKYGRNQQKLSDIIEEKTIKRIINEKVDLATETTWKYLDDIEKYRKLALMPSVELARAYNEANTKRGKVGIKEFKRIYESTKAIKNAIESLNKGYYGIRKALGMDREEEKKKRQPKKDILQDVNEDELDDLIEKLDD